MLRRARDLADEVELLRENLKEVELHTVSSPNMDGMPKGSGDGDAMARVMIRKESLQKKIRTAERAMNRSRSEGRRALRNVRAPMRMFCEVYFLEAGGFEEACAHARISPRSGDECRAHVNRIE